MAVADLLLELFSEEIPARMQAEAERHLADTLAARLKELSPKLEIVAFSTPRRLAVWIRNLPLEQAASEAEIKGPKTNAPDAAMQGFLKKTNLLQSDLVERDGVYFALVKKEGRRTADALKPLIEDILHSFPWPKSMRWGAGEQAWVRPVHSILCLFDGKIVPVEFTGIKASDTTRGHRFLAPATITIANPGEYEAALEKAFVIASRDKRKANILAQLEASAQKAGLVLKKDEGLLSEVTGLVEYPVVFTGAIDAKYMDLPKEVLVSEMRAHQKYFALLVPSPPARGQGEGPHPDLLPEGEGVLAPQFLITSNMQSADNGKAIVAGNERVLRARLADGRFFWDQDRKKRLSDWAEGLKTVTFHAKLGTVADKVERIKALADQLAPYCHPALVAGAPDRRQEIPQQVRVDIQRAACLCKADLTTGMVGEFPELQGVMGRYYALAQKEDAAVADAILQHYKPQGPTDSVPTHPVSVCIALADKLDTLISMFAIGEKPTGSKDPFALRRAALGVIRTILENNIRLPLKSLFAAPPVKIIALQKAHDKLAKQTEVSLHEAHKVGKYLVVNESACEDAPIPENLTAMLYEFFADRLKVQLKESGIRHDVIAAVMADGDDDLVRIVKKATAVQDFINTDDGKNLLAGYKRAANILAIEEKKDGIKYKGSDLDDVSLIEPEETRLRFSYTPQKNEELNQWLQNERYLDFMKWLATLRTPVDQFFDKIMVNHKDEKIRANRLCLLALIKEAMDQIADFSLIESDAKEQRKGA